MRDKGICLLDRQGKRVHWTPFHDDDGFSNNVCVVGQDGPAKHIFMREMLMSTLKCGGRVFVFDYDGRYKNLCSSCNGSLFSFNRGSNLCINPFSALADDREDRPLEFIHLGDLLTSMICKESEIYKIHGLLSWAIQKTWGTYKQQTTMTKIAEILLSIGEAVPHEFAKKLNPYTKNGEYAEFFEGQCNLDLNNPMVVFDLSGLSKYPKLQSIVFQTLMVHISSHFFYADNKMPFQVMINEPSFLLARRSTENTMSDFIEAFIRKTRRHDMSLVANISELRKMPVYSSIELVWDYAGWKVLFQSDDIKRFRSLMFNCMNYAERALAENIQTGEVYIKGLDSYVVGRVQAEGVESGVKE